MDVTTFPVVLGLVLLIAALGVILAWKVRKGGYKHEPDYKAFFWMGLVWMVFGGPFIWLFDNYSMSGLFSMGAIFFVIGLANRDKWGKQQKLTPGQMKRKMIAVTAGVVALLSGIIALLLLI
jgi:peptidoglycan/LPS O-acetylase OafA/YrhL